MNARLAVVAGIVVLVIVAAVVGVLATRGAETPVIADPTPSVTTSEPSDGEGVAPADDLEPAAAGRYETYSEEAVATSEGRILLFFHASWCPQCRAIEEDIREQGVPDGVTILHVDYDTNQDLRQRYGVTLQTTFVEVDSGGDALQTHVAYDEPTLDAVVAAML